VDTEKTKQVESLDEISKRLSKMGYTLDAYDLKDKEALYEIFREVVDSGQFPFESSSRDEFERQFFSRKEHLYVCHSLDGEVIGGFYIKPNFLGMSNQISNAGFMVRDTHRGQGLGSLLAKSSLHLAKDLGFRAMQFNMVTDTLTVNFYEKIGFKVLGIVPQAVPDRSGNYQDSFIMHRFLKDL
jgi:L-amino acid N-acyltransferase YncA